MSSQVTSLLLPHCDVICDLLLNRRTETRNLVVGWKSDFYLLLMLQQRKVALHENSWQTLTCISKKKITLTKVGRKPMQIGHLAGCKVPQLQHRQQLGFALVIRGISVPLEDLCVLWRKQRKKWTIWDVSKTDKNGRWARKNSWKWLAFWRIDHINPTKAAVFSGCNQD